MRPAAARAPDAPPIHAAMQIPAFSSASWGIADAVVVPGDITTDAPRIVEEAVDALGGLHVLVNNAGAIRRNVRLHELEPARWEQQLEVNLTAHFRVLHAALPHLLAATGDR